MLCRPHKTTCGAKGCNSGVAKVFSQGATGVANRQKGEYMEKWQFIGVHAKLQGFGGTCDLVARMEGGESLLRVHGKERVEEESPEAEWSNLLLFPEVIPCAEGVAAEDYESVYISFYTWTEIQPITPEKLAFIHTIKFPDGFYVIIVGQKPDMAAWRAALREQVHKKVAEIRRDTFKRLRGLAHAQFATAATQREAEIAAVYVGVWGGPSEWRVIYDETQRRFPRAWGMRYELYTKSIKAAQGQFFTKTLQEAWFDGDKKEPYPYFEGV